MMLKAILRGILILYYLLVVGFIDMLILIKEKKKEKYLNKIKIIMKKRKRN